MEQGKTRKAASKAFVGNVQERQKAVLACLESRYVKELMSVCKVLYWAEVSSYSYHEHFVA